MNAKRIGLTSLAVLLTLGGLITSAASCVPTASSTANCTFVPISGNGYFTSTYAGTVQNGIFAAGAISDFGAFLAANLINLFVLAIVLVVVFMVWDRFYRK